MKSTDVTWKSIVLTFVIAAGFYVVVYSWLQKRQMGKGPWHVNFTTNSAGLPRLIIHQSSLGISNVVVQFVGERPEPVNQTGVVQFAKPRQPVPFGVVLYDDLMFQPGAVALDCFGHVVEMVPSALGLNGLRLGWTNDSVHFLSASNKLPADARKKFKGGYRR
jgi:hypothetical protein